jgi:hypothetical protein
VTHNAVHERDWHLWQADLHLRSARLLAVEHPDWIYHRAGWTDAEHARLLEGAYGFYLAAGLGLLAGRVRWLARQRGNVLDAWEKFDRLNAGGCGVA